MMRIRHRTEALLACLLLSGACGCGSKKVSALYGGSKGLQVLQSPEKVEAFRVEGLPIQGKKPSQQLGGYPITAGPVTVDSKTAGELFAILADKNTYNFELKNCSIRPGVALRFTGQSTVLEVLLCFTCDELAILLDGKGVRSKYRHRYFDKARARLVPLMKRIFPADPEIQQLKSVR